MDLFDFNDNEEKAKPLAERMRASTLDEFVGQKHLVAEGSLLRRAIALDRLGSCIFWGPPGCGKTTLANVIAAKTNADFIKLNAVNAGVADVKKAVDGARDKLKMYGRRTYRMLDECHRFNKTQSDSLLPAIEQGTIVFIGSTTENPYASMTPAIVSRCRVFEFRPLSEADIRGALERALADKRKGLGGYAAQVDDAALDHIARTAGGDLRTAYNALVVATSALTAFLNLGYPEGLLPLSEAIVYVCEAEKSGAVKNAMFAAQKDARERRDDAIPAYLRDVSYGSREMKAEREKYLYPHDFGGWVAQQYLPDSLKDRVYYAPTDNGYEHTVREIRRKKGQE